MKSIYFIVFACLGILNSCDLYRQNVVNTPFFEEKGQVQAGGHIGFAGYDGQVAVSVSNKLAVLGNYSTSNFVTNYASSNFSKLNHQFYEFGFGHFRKTSNDLIHEYFLLVGQGSTNMQTTTTNSLWIRSADYTRITLQADFGKVANKIEYGLTSRLFLIDYHAIVDTQNDSYKTTPHTFLMSDLSFSFRYSPIKYVKIASQVSLTLPVTGIKYAYYQPSPFNASLGVVLNLR